MLFFQRNFRGSSYFCFKNIDHAVFEWYEIEVAEIGMKNSVKVVPESPAYVQKCFIF